MAGQVSITADGTITAISYIASNGLINPQVRWFNPTLLVGYWSMEHTLSYSNAQGAALMRIKRQLGFPKGIIQKRKAQSIYCWE